MTHSITATVAARQFSDLLNRVRYRDETFVIVRNGEEVAQLSKVISPTPPLGNGPDLSTAPRKQPSTFRQLLYRLEALGSTDPEFASHLDEIQTQQPAIDGDPWTS